ncbi:GIY-YIG nuclease family protein [Dyella acidiphila]|uniref:GIY-YIG nuclease family protein n=1 Tax=Dyella acidiphila TaxID=2775866 RepID=A0ABR9G5W3_9GAMM|nr:GIY-YIG nuclease family protein [Dyella acidiphila]MBE1159439.1 GIY-YIG nuclease family protein [Dyella acidiphila]
MRSRQPCVYMLATKRNGTLYVGVTSDLVQRIWQHQSGAIGGFTRLHAVHQLVWYEAHDTMESAIRREKLLKKWHRDWKLNLIESSNPYWHDLFQTLL